MSTTDLSQLDRLSAQGQRLSEGGQAFDTHQEFVRWVDRVADWLSAVAPNTGLASEWRSLKRSRLVHGGAYYDSPVIWDDFYAAVQARLEWLGQLPSRLGQAEAVTLVQGSDEVSSLQRVFVVHGRDEAAKEAAARLVERLGLKAVVLHEQPNRGQTLIEKLEFNSNVSFAIVLLTPDDIGGEKGEDSLQPRARQNVILELGLFIGKLGRSHVCALYKGSVELPSDFSGVAYVEMDARGAWRTEVARELEAAGFQVDPRRLL